MNKLANPAPLGLAGFALTTWMLSMVNAGWYSEAGVPMVLALAFAFGGAAQFCAGLLELPRGNTFGFVAFCSYGAFWWSFALFVAFFAAHVPAAFVGWYLFMWGVFTFYMWIGSLTLNRAVSYIFLALWVTFGLLALGTWGIGAATRIGGYTGLLTAIIAFYVSAAEVINETHGRIVLPLGARLSPNDVRAAQII
ncbi:acetate uptake transporter [Acidisoma silvae]|uniref:Acetate uptake transporter n=2 Tax=Acidisoma silvae TaxID=2802396 RepID=A0A964DZK1_9PROT|nr:acetate uptake transporter [Acidisoma silvae]